MKAIELGMTRHVWGEHGVEYRIDEDTDALGLIRLQHFESNEKTSRFESLMTPEAAEAVAAQLVEMARFIREKAVRR